MAELYDFPLGRNNPIQQAHDRFAEAIAADPDCAWDEIASCSRQCSSLR
jgi:hypothetical protein